MRRLQAQRLAIMAHYEQIIAEREQRRKDAEEEAKPVRAVKHVKAIKPPTPKKVVAAVRAAIPVAQRLPVVARTDPTALIQQLQLTAALQHFARLNQAQRDAEQDIKDIDRQIQVKRQQDDVELVLLLAA